MKYYQYYYFVVVIVVREHDPSTGGRKRTPSCVNEDYFFSHMNPLLKLKGGAEPQTDTVPMSQLKHAIKRCVFYWVFLLKAAVFLQDADVTL